MPCASSAETPNWCQELIKLSKERVEEPPLPPITVEEPPTPEESQETEEILRENVCNTPLDIMEDSNMSEANSVGLTEITSTSQTVQDSVLDSNTPNEFQPDESHFVEKLAISEVREVHQDSDEFEHVDSTSNFNDEECEPDVEAPTVKTYVVESTVQQTQEGIVCSEVISEIIAEQHVTDVVCEIEQQQQQPVSAVSNSVFEQFVSEQVVTDTDHIESVVSESVIQEPEVNVSDYTPSLRDSLDSDDIPDEDDSCQTNRLEMEQDLEPSLEPSPEPVLQDKDAEEVYSQAETDELTSPIMEPISGNDFANYLSSLNSESYDDLQKDFITTAGDLTVNRKRKNGERVVRTYNSMKARLPKVDIPETEPRKSVISDKTTERRVPLNGEKVVRFADDLWEPVYTKSFKLSKREMACFTPEVRVKKRRYYDGLLDEEEREREERGPGTADDIRGYVQPPIVFEPQYTHLLPAYNAKTILERQDYLKDEKQQRAVVQKRPHFAGNNNFVDPSTSYEKKLPDVVQTKKRGTDLNINLSIPKFESLSLNSSFQHHFCTDISTCSSSACYTPPTSEPMSQVVPPCPGEQSQPQIETRVYPPHPQAQSVLPQQPPPKPSPPPVLAQATPAPPSPVLAQPAPQPVLQQVSQSPANQYTSQSQPVNYKADAILVTSTSQPLPPTPPAPVSVPNVPPPPQTTTESPILPAQVPYWHTVDFSDHSPKYDLSAQTLESAGPNLLVNINLDQSNADHEIHLPIKKRRVSSLKVEIKDEISYPPTPMISIAELENMKTEGNIPNVGRPFKTPAELKEVPPLPASYMCNISTVPNHVVTDNFNINHTYNNPTINYHVNNVPVINFQYTPHYQLPTLQPIILPVNRTASAAAAAAANSRAGQTAAAAAAATYGYVKMPTAGKSAQTSSGGSSKRRSGSHSSSRTTERKEKKSKRT